MQLSGLDVVVLGGGIAGLAAACALAQRGASVKVLEQAAAFREVGAGLQISPNGARVLSALGQGPALAQIGLRSQSVVLRDASRGKEVLHLSLPLTGPGFHLVHRADLVELLANACNNVSFRFASFVEKVFPEGPRPVIVLADGERLSADLLIGADGLHSVVRPALQPDAPKTPFFTGQVAWRALVAGSADDEPHAQVFMGPGRHLVSYPLRNGQLRNLVAVEERTSWAQEGWTHPDDPAHIRASFAGFGGPVPDWLSQIEKVWLWGLFRHPVAERWHKGHTVILGDAAHPTLPFMAQGANLALEDAFVLARCLGAGTDIGSALARYQEIRHARVAKVVAAANRNARNYHLRTPLAQIAHLALRFSAKIAPDAPLRKFSWIYDHDVTET